MRILGQGGTGAVSRVLRRFAITGVMVRTGEGWRIRLLRAYLLASESNGRSPGGG